MIVYIGVAYTRGGGGQDFIQQNTPAMPMAAAPMTPRTPANQNATTHTPSRRFVKLADSPAAQFLSALDLQVLSSLANILSAGGGGFPPFHGTLNPALQTVPQIKALYLLHLQPTLKFRSLRNDGGNSVATHIHPQSE